MNGAPWGRLSLHEDFLYGITNGGGVAGQGTLFRVKTDGTEFSVIHEFDGIQGRVPAGGVVVNSGVIYGSTNATRPGFEWRNGLIYRVDVDGNHFQVLHTFDSQQGFVASPGMILRGSALLGATSSYISGIEEGENPAIIFSINTDGTEFQNHHVFDLQGQQPPQPREGFFRFGDYFFGATQIGGTINFGNFYRFYFPGDPLAVSVQEVGSQVTLNVIGEPIFRARFKQPKT